jgi:hypothetical protein
MDTTPSGMETNTEKGSSLLINDLLAGISTAHGPSRIASSLRGITSYGGPPKPQRLRVPGTLKWTPKIGQVAKLRIASTINRNTEVINHVKETQNTSPGV